MSKHESLIKLYFKQFSIFQLFSWIKVKVVRGYLQGSENGRIVTIARFKKKSSIYILITESFIK